MVLLNEPNVGCRLEISWRYCLREGSIMELGIAFLFIQTTPLKYGAAIRPIAHATIGFTPNAVALPMVTLELQFLWKSSIFIRVHYQWWDETTSISTCNWSSAYHTTSKELYTPVSRGKSDLDRDSCSWPQEKERFFFHIQLLHLSCHDDRLEELHTKTSEI